MNIPTLRIRLPDGREETVPITVVKSGPACEMWWEKTGECWERLDDSDPHRRPDLDWGTPNGDLLIDPWMQDELKKKA